MNKILFFCFLLLLSFPGCGKKTSSLSDIPLVSEDFPQGEANLPRSFPIMETESGYYYNSNMVQGSDGKTFGTTDLLLHYYDKATEKNIFLCNKPECKHDGNPFCAATSNEYSILGMQLYSGRIYMAALSVTDTSMNFKLLAAAPEGSDRSELITYYTHDILESGFAYTLYKNYMIIHRNKVILQLYINENPDLEDTMLYGTAIYDLETGELNYIYEEPVSTQNPEWTEVSVYGDYVYYVEKQAHKKILHRYHLTDHTDETFKLLTNFRGQYTVYDENTIYYLRSTGSTLCVHHIQDNTNEEFNILTHKYVVPVPIDPGVDIEALKENLLPGEYIQDDTIYGKYFETTYNAESLSTDGEYLYLIDRSYYLSDSIENALTLHVYSGDLEQIAAVLIPDAAWLSKAPDGNAGEYHSNDSRLHFCGDKIYLVCADGTDYYFCDRQTLLSTETGTVPDFQKLFTQDIPERNLIFSMPE